MRILIVEDEPALGNALKTNLEAESYVVDWERDGARGLVAAKVNDYDAIVLDDILPGRRGFEICQELRRVGRVMPILFMTAEDELGKRVASLDEGADDYLPKPFAYAEMSARLRALLRRPRIVREETLSVDSLTLDPALAGASRAGNPIYLTVKEYALLHYLMLHVGRVVTRAMILEHVWDNRADAAISNMIETHIYNLRQKIDKPGMKKLIKTISGRGYMMTAS